jgi:cellulose synthase/poly-beta-1,6-N-acetylglucosamine synthase-like glycosyltransferase
VLILYILAAIAILQGLVTLLDGIRAARHLRSFRPRRTSRERVIVFCPCKGTDDEFDGNIQSILNQDHPNYTTQFIVESAEDPAYARLQALGAGVIVAGRATTRGQKVHNLAFAVEHCTELADIYVFCDSDARFPVTWLSRLLAPLAADNVTTGYRWYAVQRFHFPTLMRSAWNASSVSILGNHNRNFAWGGSTAIYRDTFQRLKILDAWAGSVSDDYSVTRTAQRAGTKIVFVPECLVPSYGECSFGDLLEFTTRQIIITRVYHPALWRVGFAGHIIFTAAFWILLFTHPGIWFVIYALSTAKSWIRYRAVQAVIPPLVLSRHGWFYILSSPLVALLYLYNMIASAISTEIVWRQIHYKLVSPNETRVFGDSAASGS